MAPTPSAIPCPPASEPWAMITSTPSSAALRAWPTVWTWCTTLAPAPCARSTSSPGCPRAKETTAGFASRVARKAASSSSGTTWLTAKGRGVISRTRAICVWMLSADSKTAPMLPRPPAPETAATSSGAVAGQIAACMIGTSISNKSHTGVFNTALLPAPPGADHYQAPHSTHNMVPPSGARHIRTRPVRQTS
jgi:hypothetical protein